MPAQPTQLDTDVLYYKESGGGGVQAIEPVVSLKRDFGDLHVLGATAVIDSLSGPTSERCDACAQSPNFCESVEHQPSYRSRAPRRPSIPWRNGELTLRLEEYEQRPTVQSSALPGLQGLNLNPNLKAAIVQLGWRVLF